MKSIELIAFKDPKSSAAEVYKTLRTNIRFTSFQKDIKTIVFTSTAPNEGKSTVVANLGITMAQAGCKVLIIDGDLRNPSVHKNFLLQNSFGLTNILMENDPYKSYIQTTEVKNLDVILCGPKPPNPSELLGSSEMKDLLLKLKEDYDYILIDTPPATFVTDAALLASISDGTILVIASGETVIQGAIRAKELLQNVGANILGVVHNKVKDHKSTRYYNYYNYNISESDKLQKGKKRSLSNPGVTHV